MRIMIFAFLVGATLGGCTTAEGERQNRPVVSQKVADRLALCGAGINASLSASLEAKIDATLQEGGKLSAGIKEELATAYFNGADRSNDQVRHAYEKYVGCVEKQPL